MESLIKTDELNIQGKKSKILPIQQFFRGMDLPEWEIDERIDMAEQMKPIFLWLFALVTSYFALGREFDRADLVESVKARLFDLAGEYGLIEGSLLPNYERAVVLHIEEVAEQIVDTTLNYGEKTAFYVSDERATALAENETNVFENTLRENRAVRSGATKKRWVTEHDNKVRPTHQEVDGTEIGINELFYVGDALMRFPCDPDGTPEEVANCRCTCEYF